MKVLIFLLSLIIYALAQNNAETHIVNAAFEDIAPCPCDLTRDSCDKNCCCDSQCTDSERETFSSCIPFLAGGQEAETQQYKCASNHHAKEDWFPFLCVVFEYNAFLGYFYDWQFKLANNTQTFLNRLNTVSYYWYREQEPRTTTDFGTVYSYGISVKTKKEASTTANTPEYDGILVLPQQTLSGECLAKAPVRYLKELDHGCSYVVTSSLCNSDSILSSLFYIQANAVSGATTYFHVVGEAASMQIAETNVVYKCVNATYLNSYFKSQQNSIDLSQISSPAVDMSCVGNCGLDLCLDASAADPTVPATNLTDCSDQNPTIPSTGAVCQNSVIDVSYTIRWQGASIAVLDAVIILADVPFDAVLTQKYKVSYVHNVTEVSTDATDNFYNITDEPYQRSGKVGYDIGKDMFSGVKVMNTSLSPEQLLFVNLNTSRQMAVFDTGVDGLCETAGRRTIKFGEDITTACKLQLDVSNLTDCSSLRRYMIYYLNSMMPSDVIGRRGYNDIYNTAYWINVLRDDETEFCTLSEYFPPGLSPVDNLTGICYNISNGIHLDVFYAETGQSNGYPIYEVLGSKISMKNSTFEVKCSSSSGGPCTGSTAQAFYLTSSVKFTQIPPQVPEPISKYYETPREDDRELCPGQRCWDDLFYPFTGRYMADSREYVFGTVSFAIIFFVGYGLVTRPWW